MARHCIFGSGLIGSYLGLVLKANGQEVSFVARGQWAERLRSGLALSDLQAAGLPRAPVDQVYSTTETPPISAQAIWLTVKCTQVKETLEDVARWVGPDTEILCCQNGLGSDALVRQAFPDNTVRRVMVPFNVVFEAPHRLHRSSEGRLMIESLGGQDPHLQQWVESLSHPMLQVGTSENILPVLWAKLQLNLGNSVNALSNVPVKQMLECRDYRRVIAAAMDELLAIARAMDMPLPKVARLPGRFLPVVLRLPDWLFFRLASKMLSIDPKARASMWWDLSQGKKTEIAYLNGAVVEQATRRALPCKVNQALVAAITRAETQSHTPQGYVPWSAKDLLQLIE